MNPWNAIGWIVLIPLLIILGYWAVKLIVAIIVACYVTFRLYLRHKATRDITPEKGQIWVEVYNSREKVYIESVYPTHVNCTDVEPGYNYGSRCHWGHSLEDWKTRVYNRKMILLDERWGK